MLHLLDKLYRKVEYNKKERQKLCMGCPLVDDYDGPVFIEHEGDLQPRVIIISESPAGYEKIDYDFARLNEWKVHIFREIKGFKNWKKIGHLSKLSRYLAGMTNNKMVDKSNNKAIVNNIYWTHTVKCFIQRKEPIRKIQEQGTIKDAKKKLRKKFDEACKYCSEYLFAEIEIIKPEIIITIGSAAFKGICPENKIKKKDIVGKSIKYGNAELIYNYHSNAQISGELKRKGFEYARQNIAVYL